MARGIVSFELKGSFDKTEKYLKKLQNQDEYARLESLAQEGVRALSSATPVDTGKTASSWGYRITRSAKTVEITWTNSNVVKGQPIAILLQYGHGTGTGGYVQGRDYINPAIKPIMDKISDQVWKAVSQ